MKNARFPFVLCVAIASVFVAPGAADAHVSTFFGEDLGLGESTRLPSHPNADAAAASFLSTLRTGVGVEDFEGFTAPTILPITIDFPGSSDSIQATLSSGTIPGEVWNLPTGAFAGRYPISGDQFLTQVNSRKSTSGTALTVDFDKPISAFGFYGVDIGDFDGVVELELTNGGAETVSVGNSANIDGGSVLFFGLTATFTFDRVVFSNTGSGSDAFGFDDMTIGDLGQIQYAAPIADPNGPYEIQPGDGLTLDGSASFDGDGVIDLYEWDMDDDAAQFSPAGLFELNTPGATISLTNAELLSALGVGSLNDGDVFDINLRVTDNLGLPGFAGAQIIVIPEPATMMLMALGGLAVLRRRSRLETTKP